MVTSAGLLQRKFNDITLSTHFQFVHICIANTDGENFNSKTPNEPSRIVQQTWIGSAV